MRKAVVGGDASRRFDALVTRLSTAMVPLLGPARKAQAEALGIDAELLSMYRPEEPFGDGFSYSNAEIFIEDGCLYIITLDSADKPDSFIEESDGRRRFSVYAISPGYQVDRLNNFIEICSDAMGAALAEYRYPSKDFKRLKEEVLASSNLFGDGDVVPSKVLSDRSNRELAIKIKQSFGLLVGDLGKKGNRGQLEGVIKSRLALEDAGLISSEFMVICGKTSQQTARAPSADVIQQMDLVGIKCACGKSMSQERLEEALTITDLGRSLLDKSKWLSVLVMDGLVKSGVSPDEIIVESTIGGDELDCIACINGEIFLFELKDKEFNLREAYSFGAKVDIVKPHHAVIVTSEYVGGDAKDHFSRSRKVSRNPYAFETAANPVIYIEGLDNLRDSLAGLVFDIHKKDAARLLKEILPFAALDSTSLVSALTSERAAEEGSQGVATVDTSGPE
ncbi:hypothetical protein SUDANB171_02677 [Streptomyces sp. enrichment culture]